MSRYERGVVWLRRDLRVSDHRALFEAQRACDVVCPVFVIDPGLLRGGRMGAPLVQCFFSAIAALRDDLRERGGDLAILEDENSGEAIVELARRIGAGAVFFNVDYEPHAIERDRKAERAFRDAGIDVNSFTDHVYFGAGDVLRGNGSPYQVFTAYRRHWMERFAAEPRPPLRSALSHDRLLSRRAIGATNETPIPETYGFESSPNVAAVSEAIARRRLAAFVRSGIGEYEDRRNFPATAGTSQLSPHLRAGTIGIRTCIAAAARAAKSTPERRGAQTWLSELIWRDFYQMILKHWPGVATGPFIRQAERIQWRRADGEFDAWCEGRTGFPIVDAAMQQLNTYGWMHNRLRMIVASFLTKDLLIDWRRGERYFEHHLVDADLAANNGGWQWSASTGLDAAPYFRVFNPVLQGKRFDPDGEFVRAMLPALKDVPGRYIHEPWEMPPIVAGAAGVTIGTHYPEPIVDHAAARKRALDAYSVLKT
jgi:deoxyribodipyrimidine photo-lyase